MNNVERRDKEMPYISDQSVMEQQMTAHRLTQQLNTVDRSDFDSISKIVKELLGKSEGAFINPPFYCDYGFNIEVGKSFFANYNCTILDVAKVIIGDNVIIGAGSVVTKDIPDWSIASGNSCKVLRKITDADRKYYYKDREFDSEAWQRIVELGLGGE